MISVYYITHLEETSTSGKTMSRNKYKACYRRVKSQVKKISRKKNLTQKKKIICLARSENRVSDRTKSYSPKICIFNWLVSKHWKINRNDPRPEYNCPYHYAETLGCSFRDHSQKKHASPLPDGLQQTFHLKINKVNQVWQ